MLNRIFQKCLLLLLLLGVFSCVGVKKHNAQLGKLFSPEEMRTDIDFAYSKLKKLQPRLYQYISKNELDQKFDSLKKSISKPMDAKQFYKSLSPVISEVRQGHNANGFPDRMFSKKEQKILKKQKLDFYELDVAYADEGLWVTRTGKYDSVLIGSQILGVGLETIPNLLKRFRKTISTDGYNTRFKNKYIAKNFTGFYRKHEGFKDSVSVLFKKGDSIFPKHFKRYLRDSSAIKKPKIDSIIVPQVVKISDAEKAARKLKRKNDKKRTKKFGHIARGNLYTRNFKFIDTARQIGYLKIRSWGNGPYKKFYKETFAKLDSSKTKNLIIDLRNNLGGRLDEIHKFYSYLTNAEYVFVNPAIVNGRLPYIKGFYGPDSGPLSVVAETIVLPFAGLYSLLKTSKKDGKFLFHYYYSKKSKPNAMNFKGNIYVLINGASYSASSILASKLHGTKRAVFIGEETGGAYNGTVAGQYKIISLPNTKLRYRLGLMQIETPHTQEPDGYGVKPDYEVIPTAQDIQENRDPELEKVLALIAEQ